MNNSAPFDTVHRFDRRVAGLIAALERRQSLASATRPGALLISFFGCSVDIFLADDRVYTGLKPGANMEIPDQSCHSGGRVSFPRHRLRMKLQRLAADLAVAVFFFSLANGATAPNTLTLPVEVVGENGTTSSVTVEVPYRRAPEIRSLWMQVHG